MKRLIRYGVIFEPVRGVAAVILGPFVWQVHLPWYRNVPEPASSGWMMDFSTRPWPLPEDQ